jgi:adenylylsulfate kinase
VQSGFVTICSFITPLKSQRALAQEIIGSADFIDIYVEASYLTCARRDPKGLYKRASANQLAQFTGKDSLFEPPDKKDCRFIVNTEAESVDVSVSRLRDFVIPHLRLPKPTITSVSFSLETPHRGA